MSDEMKKIGCPMCGKSPEEHSVEQAESCMKAYREQTNDMLEKMELASYVSMGRGEPPIIALDDLTGFDPSYDKKSLTRLRTSCGTNRLYERCVLGKYGITLSSTHEGCFHSNPVAGPLDISWQEIADAVKTGQAYEKSCFGRTQVRISNGSLIKLLELHPVEAIH